MHLMQYQRAALLRCRSPYARLVLTALVTFASGDGPGWRVWPGNDALLALTGISAPTLARTLRELEADGWISRSTSGPMRREITLTHPPLTDHAPPSDRSGTPLCGIRQGDLSEHDLTDTPLAGAPSTPLCEIRHPDLSDQAPPSERSGRVICQRGPENDPCSSREQEQDQGSRRSDLQGASRPNQALTPGQREEKKSPCPAPAPAAPVTPDLPLRVPPREDAHAAHERTHEAATAARGALSPQAQGQGRALSALSEPEAGPDLAQAWARLWGGAAPAPPALLWLRRERGREAALTALSWLLYRRAAEGVRSPGRVAQYLADDLREGRRQARGWRWEELEEVARGASPLSFWAPEAGEGCEVEEVAQGFEAEEVQPEPAEPIAPPEVARVYLRQMRLARLICEGRSDDMRGRAEGRYRDGAPYRPDRYPPAGATEADWDAWGERELEAQEARAALRLVAGGAA